METELQTDHLSQNLVRMRFFFFFEFLNTTIKENMSLLGMMKT